MSQLTRRLTPILLVAGHSASRKHNRAQSRPRRSEDATLDISLLEVAKCRFLTEFRLRPTHRNAPGRTLRLIHRDSPAEVPPQRIPLFRCCGGHNSMESLSLLLNPPEPAYPPQKRRPSLAPLLWRRRRTGVTVFLAAMIVTGVCLIVFPRTYEASMQFMVNNDRVSTPIGSDSSTQALVYINDINEAQVNTEVSLLTSNDLLLDLVRKAGLADDANTSSREGLEQSALQTLKAHLQVVPLRRSAVIDVRYRSNNRDKAVHVLNVLSALYLDAHARLHGTPAAYAVFEKLWEDASEQRVKAEAALSDFKQQHRIVSLPDEKTIALQREADLERQYADALVAAGKSGRQTQQLQETLSHTPSVIEGERRSIPSQGEIEHLNSVLSGLRLKRIEAASRYLPTDRIITDLDQQIDETKAALAAASSRKAEEVSMISNPVLHDAQTELTHARSQYAGYQEEAEELHSKLYANRRQLVALDREAATYNLLNDNVTRFTNLDHLYRQKADTAGTDDALNANHVSNVTLAETPFAPSERSPRISALLAVGTAWSLLLSLIAILIVDRVRTRVTSPFEIEHTLGAPVVAILGNNASLQHPWGYVPAAYGQISRSAQ